MSKQIFEEMVRECGCGRCELCKFQERDGQIEVLTNNIVRLIKSEGGNPTEFIQDLHDACFGNDETKARLLMRHARSAYRKGQSPREAEASREALRLVLEIKAEKIEHLGVVG